MSAPCGYINILINNVSVKALWDSGAKVNVMQERKARQLGINITEGLTNIQGFDGTLSVTKGGARSVQVDIGGVNGLLYFVIVERANNEVVLVSLSVLKGNAKKEGTLGFNASSTYGGLRDGSTSYRVDPKFENLCSVPIDHPTLGTSQQSTFSDENVLKNNNSQKNNNNSKKTLENNDLEKKTLHKKTEKKEEDKFIKRRQKIAHMLCNIMSTVEDEEQLEEIDEYLINPNACYPSFDHLIQLDLEKKEDLFFKVHTINTIRKKVTDKVQPQNVPLPEDAQLEQDGAELEV
ncbi:hypothetical protein HMI54_011958 [Coelomomyces lativittatus]|nr:hypothetical protein HMI54_011958 [Coelomomyces lativittatus]